MPESTATNAASYTTPRDTIKEAGMAWRNIRRLAGSRIRSGCSGLSRRAAAARFGVAAVSAVRLVREWRETGATCARPQGGDRRSHRVEAYRDIILAAIKRRVDITPVELVELLRQEHGASFATSTIGAFSIVTL
ncbi:hypothetical protein [Mesorhizobium australicum]|uniref:hypothetical protein n=1 Tax=Mesorhizobium australicum TaxID=536018 RepID=UPI0033352AD3